MSDKTKIILLGSTVMLITIIIIVIALLRRPLNGGSGGGDSLSSSKVGATTQQSKQQIEERCKDNSDLDACRRVKTAEAARAGSADICATLTGGAIDDCYYEAATAHGDAEICKHILSKGVVDQCVSTVLFNGSVGQGVVACQKIPDGFLRAMCMDRERKPVTTP